MNKKHWIFAITLFASASQADLIKATYTGTVTSTTGNGLGYETGDHFEGWMVADTELLTLSDRYSDPPCFSDAPAIGGDASCLIRGIDDAVTGSVFGPNDTDETFYAFDYYTLNTIGFSFVRMSNGGSRSLVGEEGEETTIREELLSFQAPIRDRDNIYLRQGSNKTIPGLGATDKEGFCRS